MYVCISLDGFKKLQLKWNLLTPKKKNKNYLQYISSQITYKRLKF